MHPNARRRSGFTLIEVAVASVIIAMMAAVTAPSLVAFLDKQHAEATADRLAALAAGIAAFGDAVKSTGGGNGNDSGAGGTYPGLISELTNPIAANSQVIHNSCGSLATGTFSTTAVSTWTSNAPFVNFYVPQGGLNTPLGIVADSMVRTPTGGSPGTLGLRIVGVDTAAANLLDLIVDGGDGGGRGTLRVTNVNGGQAEIIYLVPVGARC
jgi:prepilin-type N-terminal cleavage/methylation domain-containing protein